uniref:Oxidative stress-responsive protein 1 n=1 Tax=Parastrongyloides trichosuri TaxID=131310 RepID=A0A0N4ZU83_PARTI
MNDKNTKIVEIQQLLTNNGIEEKEMLVKVNETIISLNSLSVQPSTSKIKKIPEDKKNSERARSLKRFSPYQSPKIYSTTDDTENTSNRGRSNSFHCKEDEIKYISNKDSFRNRRHTLGSLDSLCDDDEKKILENDKIEEISNCQSETHDDNNTNSNKNGVNITNSSCSFEMCKKPKYSEDADFIGEMDELSDYFNHFVGVEMKMSSLAESMYA